jgi:hypothetical protein
MSKVLSELRLSLVSYIVSYLGLGLVLGIELVLDLGLECTIVDCRLDFFKYPLYSRILVLLVLLYTTLKLLLSLRRCSS